MDKIKEKLNQVLGNIREKLSKVAFLQKFLEKKPKEPKPVNPLSMRAIYSSGGTKTRLQVIFVYLFAFLAVGFTAYATKKFLSKINASATREQIEKDYSSEFAEIKEKAIEKATTINVGQFTVKAKFPDHKEGFLSFDLWAKIDDPEAAVFFEKNETIVEDIVVEIFNQFYADEISLLNEAGKETGKKRLQEAFNQKLHKGSVVDLFFHNLIAQ
ncbi:MAG: flagellar basal body-associated FliL family protein [Oligoflexia bacterium]|nr:flagellar basal body-associated FliL family protein [Oligoflexia bacterium]